MEALILSRLFRNLAIVFTASSVVLTLLMLLGAELPELVIDSVTDKTIGEVLGANTSSVPWTTVLGAKTANGTSGGKRKAGTPSGGRGNGRFREPKLDCDDGDSFIVYVYSGPENGHRRQLIRETWGNMSRYRNRTRLKLRLLFAVGWRREAERNVRLEREAQTVGDLLVVDLNDSYENLTLKGLMTIDWIRSRCPVERLKFVFKTDDDVFLNFYAVLDRANQLLAKGRLTHFLCFLNQGKHPKRSGKWAISTALYPAAIYPTYCSGAGYGMTSAGFDLVTRSCFDVPRLPIEDFFFSSYCIGRVFPDVVIRYASFRGRSCRMNIGNRTLFARDLEYIARLTLAHPLPARYWADAFAIAVRHHEKRSA